MKKFLSLILSLVMVLGVSTVTFADTKTITNGGVASINPAKVYKLVNDGVNNPAETFNFQITKVGVTDSQYTESDMPMFTQTNYSIQFADGEATLAGDKNTTASAIALPTYEHVGIFTYMITETAGSTAGVTYDANPLYLKVTVTEENGQKVRYVTYHYGSETGSKTDSITNTYSAGNLAITKNVTGNMGETDRYFKVKVTLTAPTGKTVNSNITATGGKYTQPVTLSIGENELELKHGDRITINNLPYDVTYTVVEDDYTGDDYGYDAATYNWSDNNKKVDSALDTVTITNNKGRDVDTGIFVDNLPYIIILAGVAVGMGVFFMKKRTANNN